MAEDLGEKIAFLRNHLGLTQAEFAEKVKTSQPNINRIEHGQKPGWDTAKRIADFVGVSVSDLLDESEHALIAYIEEGKQKPLLGGNLLDEKQALYEYMQKKPIRVVGTASANPNATIDWLDIEHETTELGPAVAIRVHDDSMEPLAREGQFVLAIPDESIRDGDLVVVKVRRKGVYFKRAFLRGRDELELQSANPLRPQPSMTVKLKDITKQFRVIGVKFE